MHRRQVLGSSSDLAVNDFRVHLGTGGATSIDEPTSIWPSGEELTFSAVDAGSFYHLLEGGELSTYVPRER